MATRTEKGSMDSSDTFQSCQTHPYQSEEDVLENSSNLYVNPFDKKGSTGSLYLLGGRGRGVRKSGSGEFSSSQQVNFLKFVLIALNIVVIATITAPLLFHKGAPTGEIS